MRVIVLGSGSNGNSTYVECNGIKFLIDCGLSCKMLKDRLSSFNVDLEDVKNIIITHEHIDHVKGLSVLCSKISDLNVYITKGTYKGLKDDMKEKLIGTNIIYIKQDDVLDFGLFMIDILRTHHDAKEPIGMVFNEDDKRFVYVTDTGYFEESLLSKINNADIYVFESNYDVDMLYSSSRPYELKERINSSHGHMSNYDSAVMLAKAIGSKTKHVILAHVSNDCNFYDMPEIILKSHYEIYQEIGLDTSNIKFEIGSREHATGEYFI